MIVIAAASSRTHGSDSHTEAPSQPSASAWATANFKVTDTYSRRLADSGAVPPPSLATDCWSAPTPLVVGLRLAPIPRWVVT